MEGIFSRGTKTDKHPHTNMAKAALNMMTLTSARDYVEDGIHMNAVDTGWVTDEDPVVHADAQAARSSTSSRRSTSSTARRASSTRSSPASTRRARLGQVLQGLQAVHLVRSGLESWTQRARAPA